MTRKPAVVRRSAAAEVWCCVTPDHPLLLGCVCKQESMCTVLEGIERRWGAACVRTQVLDMYVCIGRRSPGRALAAAVWNNLASAGPIRPCGIYSARPQMDGWMGARAPDWGWEGGLACTIYERAMRFDAVVRGCPASHSMSLVRVLIDRRTDRQTDRQTARALSASC